MTGRNLLAAEPLTREAFVPFGEVIEIEGAERRLINEGTTERFHALAHVDVSQQGGLPIISLFRARCRSAPFEIRMLERHPLGSQAFFPLSREPWLVVVAVGKAKPDLSSLRCFRATGTQGVSYARNAWHHPLLVLAEMQDFLVVDRAGPGDNLEEFWFDAGGDRRVIDIPGPLR
jgi:ureidoglycolate lyase